jgi:PPOX class probable F420-dependent enzyme
MLSEMERLFLKNRRVAHLATADRDAAPHVVPVCFAIRNDTLYVTIDAKPKRSLSTPLKRLKNIAENPAVAVVVDRYEEDWGQLGWVMLRGHAEILIDGGGTRSGAGASSLSVSSTQENADRGASGDRRAHCKCHELG